MNGAARSGKQCIVEGTMVSGTSKKGELKLLGVARGSFEELLEDYRDFLLDRDLAAWDKDDPRSRAVRRLAYKSNRSYTTYKTYFDSPGSAANTMICLIYQTNYLLDRHIKALEKQFLEEGGFTERMYRARKAARGE